MRNLRPPQWAFRSLLAALAVVLVLAAGCARNATSPQIADSAGGSTTPRLSGITRSPQPSVAEVVLPDVSPTAMGHPPAQFVTKAANGELLVVYFGYTSCPDVCPTSMSDLKSAKRELGSLGDRVRVAMVTVDPQRDTPEILNSYLSHFFTAFHSLRTDDNATLRSAETAFGASSAITPKPDGTYDVSHSASAYAVDSAGRIVIEWPFGTKSEQMATDIRILLGGGSGEAGN